MQLAKPSSEQWLKTEGKNFVYIVHTDWIGNSPWEIVSTHWDGGCGGEGEGRGVGGDEGEREGVWR